MGQTVSNLAGAAMRIYDKVVHEQVFKKNVLFNNILKNVATSTGSTTKYISYHYDRNVGGAAGSESFTLPIAGNQQYLQGSIAMKYNFHTIQITDVAMKASARSKEFLVNALESEYNGAKNDMQRQLSRQGYSTGTGSICRVNASSPAVALIMDTPMVGKNTTDYFSIGDGIMLDSTDGSATSAVYTYITAITAANTMTVASVSGVVDNDYIYKGHSKGATTDPTVSNINAELTGLKTLIDDGSYTDSIQGQSRATYIWLQSFVDDATSQRSLTDALLQTTFLECKKKGEPKYALTSFDVSSAYGQLLSPDRRYSDTMTLNGGFTGVNFNGIPIISDYDCPFDELYFIDNSVLSVEDLAPMSFLNEDGAILDRSSTSPVWLATLRYYANLCISAPNKCASLRDIIK